MQAGAVDFLPPSDGKTLLTAVATALADLREMAECDRATELARARIAEMSNRERQVLDRMLLGGTNKSIAKELGIGPRTVETHRGHVMQRLDAKTLPELVLLAAAAGFGPSQAVGGAIQRVRLRHTMRSPRRPSRRRTDRG